MMLPIALSVINQLKDHPNTLKDENKIFGKALMLGLLIVLLQVELQL